jgi:hypothetical protein
MRLHILADLHLECGSFQPSKVKADAVVLAGDIFNGVQGLEWALKTFPDQPVVFVAGNHEYYGGDIPKLTGELRKLAKGTNVHFLENDSVCIGDIVFLGATL